MKFLKNVTKKPFVTLQTSRKIVRWHSIRLICVAHFPIWNQTTSTTALEPSRKILRKKNSAALRPTKVAVSICTNCWYEIFIDIWDIGSISQLSLSATHLPKKRWLCSFPVFLIPIDESCDVTRCQSAWPCSASWLENPPIRWFSIKPPLILYKVFSYMFLCFFPMFPRMYIRWVPVDESHLKLQASTGNAWKMPDDRATIVSLNGHICGSPLLSIVHHGFDDFKSFWDHTHLE